MPTWVIVVLVGWSVIAPLVAVLIGKSVRNADRQAGQTSTLERPVALGADNAVLPAGRWN